MKPKVIIDIERARKLWDGGWCFNAVGKHFNCSGQTVKLRLHDFISDAERTRHARTHGPRCPLCRGRFPLEGQINLFV